MAFWGVFCGVFKGFLGFFWRGFAGFWRFFEGFQMVFWVDLWKFLGEH